MTKEEQEQMLRNRGSMIGAAQGPLTLGGGGSIPAFPSGLSSVNPDPATKPIPFGGGGTASMGLGGANVNYPSRLGLGGGDYGTRFQFGAEEFGGARLPQATTSLTASPTGFDRPLSFMDARSDFNQANPQNPASQMEATIAGFTPAGMQPQQTSIPIEGGPISMGIAATPTAEQQGKTEIKTPRGSMWATPEQAASVMTPRTAGQQSSRSPAEQQALLDRIRQNAPALNQQRTDWVMNTIQQRRENPTTYITPSGMSVAVPTNRFGEPLKDWMDQLGNEGRLNYGPRPAPQTTASLQPRYGSITQPSQYPRREENATAPQQTTPSPLNNSVLASTGFGAMQRAQQESMPQAIGRSPLFAGMGYMAAFGGGPQPAGSMMAYNNQKDARTRFRRILGLV